MCFSLQVAEARREAEEKRDAKYAKMERQREEVRQGIREKVIFLFCQNKVKSIIESSPLGHHCPIDLRAVCVCMSRNN